MTVKELIKLLLECDQNKEVYFSSSSEMIHMDISGVLKEDKHFITKKDIVSIEE
jgi:hypothetical protein